MRTTDDAAWAINLNTFAAELRGACLLVEEPA